MEGERSRRRRSDGAGGPGGSSDNLPSIYDIFKGEVASIQQYGAFIRIPRCRKQGLVHKSQISQSGHVEEVSDVLEVGDHVYCKVIGMGGGDGEGEGERLKISLSMKVVNQGDGTDLDPNQVVIKQEEQRRQKHSYLGKKKIELGAVFNTVCKKCGCQGHLSQDCFQTKEGKTYDLIPETDDLQPVTEQTERHHHHKKKKKENKHKKDKHKKDRHHSKHKKHKKTAKRKQDSSSSSSDSEDSHRKSKKHQR